MIKPDFQKLYLFTIGYCFANETKATHFRIAYRPDSVFALPVVKVLNRIVSLSLPNSAQLYFLNRFYKKTSL